jgi:hypothetical protein
MSASQRRWQSLVLLIGVWATLLASRAAARSGLDERDEAYAAREALKTLCMGHRLDPAAALRHAEADGWRPLPETGPAILPRLDDTLAVTGLTGVSARWKLSPRGAMVVLLLGDGAQAGPGCAVVFRAPFSTASSVVGGHFMLPVRRFATVSPSRHRWVFVEEAGKRRRAVKSYFGRIDHALIARATAQRALATIEVIDAGEGTAVFLYSVPER